MLLDLLISALTALRDFLESLKSRPSQAPLAITSAAGAASAISGPASFIVPFFNYEVTIPAAIASRFGRRSFFAFVCLFISALLVRVVQSLLHRREMRRDRLTYTQAAEDEGTPLSSSSPLATRPVSIPTLDSISTAVTSHRLHLRREGEENLLQGQDGKLYVAVQSHGFLQVWDADDQGRPVHRDSSVAEGEDHAEECEQLLRHFSDREISASLARQPSESSSCFLLPPSPTKNKN